MALTGEQTIIGPGVEIIKEDGGYENLGVSEMNKELLQLHLSGDGIVFEPLRPEDDLVFKQWIEHQNQAEQNPQ